MRRILKPNGVGIIIETLEFKKEEDVRFAYLDLSITLSPHGSKLGINPTDVESTLNENGLYVRIKKENRGVIYIVVAKDI
ncbi:MAG: hypothetical protein ACFFDT_38950 [Candidatus Hodarchaeota archaeon]